MGFLAYFGLVKILSAQNFFTLFSEVEASFNDGVALSIPHNMYLCSKTSFVISLSFTEAFSTCNVNIRPTCYKSNPNTLTTDKTGSIASFFLQKMSVNFEHFFRAFFGSANIQVATIEAQTYVRSDSLVT